jgi:predicted membrane protein
MNKTIKNNTLFLFILFILAIFFIVCIVNRNCLPISLSDLILFITFLAILWYTYETRATRLNLEKQAEFALRPVISFELLENHAAGYRLN